MVKKVSKARVDEAMERFLATRKQHVKHRTWLDEKYTMAAVRRAAGGNVWLSELDEDFWWDYFYGDEGRVLTLSPGSFNGHLRRIRAFAEFCQRRGWIEPDVVDYLRRDIRSRAEILRQRMILTPQQLIELPEHAAYPSHRVALAIGANTALRGSEIMGIKLGKVYLDRGEMLVRLWKTNSEVMVPITSRLSDEIKLWLEVYEKATIEQGLGPLQPHWYLVPAQWPGRDREPGSTSYTKTSPFRIRIRPEHSPSHPHEIVKLAMDNMGLEYEKGEGFHTTRRGFARAFYDGLVATGDPNALRKTSALLHHANTTMTERYLGLNTESVAVSQTLRGQDFLGSLVGANSVAPFG